MLLSFQHNFLKHEEFKIRVKNEMINREVKWRWIRQRKKVKDWKCYRKKLHLNVKNRSEDLIQSETSINFLDLFNPIYQINPFTRTIRTHWKDKDENYRRKYDTEDKTVTSQKERLHKMR